MIGLIIVVVFCSTFFLWIRERRVEKFMKKFPGPPEYPFFGNTFNYFTGDLQEMKRREIASFKKYGETYRLKTIGSYFISTIDPNIFEKILSSTTHYIEKGVDYNMIKKLIGNGIILSRGNHWRSHRKVIQPAFSGDILKQFIRIFDGKAQIMVDILKSHCDGSLVHIDTFVNRMVNDINMEAMMGIKTNTQLEETSEFVEAIIELKYLIFKRIMSYWQRSDVLYSIFAPSDKQKHEQLKKITSNIVIATIEKRRKLLLEEKEANDKMQMDKNRKMCLIDILLLSTVNGKSFTNDDMFDESITFMVGGQDTSAFTIAATLYLLSRHKSVQDKLYAEINEVIGCDQKTPLTYQQLADLKYMDMVIKESMRLYPPVQLIGRNIDHDLELADGRIIPTGVDVLLHLGLMMRSPKYFENPNAFDPERFASEMAHPFAHIPFCAGIRDCIGKRYALCSNKTILTRLLQSYEFLEMGEEPIIQNEIMSRSINGFHVALKYRGDWKE